MQEKRSNEDKDDDRRKQTLKKQYRTDRNGKLAKHLIKKGSRNRERGKTERKGIKNEIKKTNRRRKRGQIETEDT